MCVLQTMKSFESLLIPQLPCSPPDVEAMRIYLILSECPALHESKNFISLTIPLAMAILRLDANPSKVLGTKPRGYLSMMYITTLVIDDRSIGQAKCRVTFVHVRIANQVHVVCTYSREVSDQISGSGFYDGSSTMRAKPWCI